MTRTATGIVFSFSNPWKKSNELIAYPKSRTAFYVGIEDYSVNCVRKLKTAKRTKQNARDECWQTKIEGRHQHEGDDDSEWSKKNEIIVCNDV